MAATIITVDDLISQARSLLDEANDASVLDSRDIIPALNRAQDYACDILSRHYHSALVTHSVIQTVSGQHEYDIPEGAFEQRLEKVEVSVNGVYQELPRVDFQDLSVYENNLATAFPSYYAIINNRFRILPASNGAYNFRVWYMQDPLPFVKQQGRITLVNSSNNYILVDSAGTDLTTEADNLNSYVNIVDAQTGARKASFQIKNIQGNKITFKTSPGRSSVRNITIDSDMTSLSKNQSNEGPDYSINQDDYICVISGSCVPVFKKPISNFLIQYAVAEMQRKLGGDAGLELSVLETFKEQVEHTWVGRQQSFRVKKANNSWPLPYRRFWGLKF